MRRTPRGADRERGVVYVEFLIVFLPFLMVILGVTQLALLYAGKAATQRAANAAVRAAVVILDDDPRYYGGAGRNTATGARREDIRMAARIPLMSLSTYGDTVRRAVGLGEAGLAGARAYTDAAVAVSFPGGDRVGRHGDVTVRVTYQMHCGVPLARWLLCHSSVPAGRATRIRAEATLPNQGARYAY